jgi:class 3 adenylate cyclase
VTVLFCDLTGSTALGETLDPERLRALLARYFERMKRIVERHGTVESLWRPDVVFGVPVLHETTLRAVRSAGDADALPARAPGWISVAGGGDGDEERWRPAMRSTSRRGWSRQPSRARC